MNTLSKFQKFNTVGIRFRNLDGHTYGKVYTYKTKEYHEEGDEVLILAPDGNTVVVQVVSFDQFGTLANTNEIRYKWIVGKVDLTAYHANMHLEAEVLTKIKGAEQDYAVQEARNELLSKLSPSAQKVLIKALDAFDN